MSKVDWSKAPEGAEFYSYARFCKIDGGLILFYCPMLNCWNESRLQDMLAHSDGSDYETRPQQWPSESRIDIIGTNGNTAEHYMDETLHETTRKHYETQVELAARIKAELEAKQKAEVEAREKAELILSAMSDAGVKEKTITSASDFLSEGLRILSERGKQYDPSGTKEMSFDNVAEAFNCLTNSRLKASDICLLLALLKVVRQNASKSFHEDSAVDFVNYAALHGELLKGEKA